MHITRNARFVIECRDNAGTLDFTGKQPESVFGTSAITGISEDFMARCVWQHVPDATLTGQTILTWPSLIDPRWKARVKTW